MFAHQKKNCVARAISIFCAIALGFTATLALAQAYPQKPIRVIVGFSPGTGSDLISRIIANRLSEQMGHSAYVENRPGAAGVIGAAAVGKAAPDGYTLLVATNAALITAPILNQQPSQLENLSVIGGIARTSMVMVTGTGPSAPRTVAELISRAKSSKSNFATPGAGSISHLTGELFNNRVGLKVEHIPHKGSSQSLTEVARGEDVLFGIDTPAAALPFIRGGRLRAVAITGDTRLASLPNSPTFVETGVADMRLYAWWGLFAPAGTPTQIVQRLSDELLKMLASADMRERLQTMELQPFPQSTEQLNSFIKTEQPFWQTFLDQSGIRLEK